MQDHLSQAVEKMRAFYDITPDAPIYQKEFGYYVLDRWIEEGYLRPRSEVQQLRIQDHFSNAVQEQLFAGQAMVQLLGLGMLVPLAEELIFRGLIYTRIRKRIPAGAAIFFSALLFALFHGNVIQMVFAFPLALILAWLYERSGWFACPLAFHMGANLTAIVLNLLS